ncbi:PadR family transcriptional regulator [uncultured Tessaracoccus sp.]|uniref:PadR family transcriptional regulator n=1 Tax=uncultured Tessaracoccus sp. TaxID=905023 RepID=UPI0025D1CC47|nr:PadR family transcriptional regulator [uncultured Tessaracoccus sp.]
MKPDYPLLGLLARHPASGYDLGKWLRIDGRFLGRRPNMSPVYRALGDLEERGWIVSTPGGTGAGPAAKVYRLTPEGRAALVAWAEEPFEPAERPMAPDFMVRMNFAGQLGPEYALAIVRAELAYRKSQRDAESPQSTGIEAVDAIPEIDDDWLREVYRITHDRGWQSTSLFIGWLETLESYLTSLVDDTGEQ